MPGTLYIVGTPIGNLNDLTPRAAATLGSVDFVAAEDTRVTLKLLNHLGLKKPLISYYDHNFSHSGEILSRLQDGENGALCSDAGMPAISDPGEILVKQAMELGIPVCPVPGPSACVTALAVSGQATGRWVFEGFLPVNRRQKKDRLGQLVGETRTIIFYEAPHKLITTLEDLNEYFGADRSITLCRELTKLHEELYKTTLREALEHYRQQAPRGEFVLIMAGAPEEAFAESAPTLEEVVERALALAEEGMKPSAAAKQACAGTPFAKNEVYRKMLEEREEE